MARINIKKIFRKVKEAKKEAKRNVKVKGDLIDPNKFYYEAKPMTSNYSLKRKQFKKDSKFFKKHKESVVLIKMEMGNGMFREFLVSEDNQSFYYKDNLYVLDISQRYYIIDRNIWAYDFHEFLSLPLRKKFQISDELTKILQPEIDRSRKQPLNPHIDINEVKTLIENSGVIDVESSINPTTLKRFTDSEVIKQVLQGAMLSKIFKIMFILIIIIAVFMLILIVIQLYSSGVISKVVGAFNG